MRRHQGSFAIDADLFDKLDQIADDEDESRSEVVNQLLREALSARAAATMEAAAWAGVGTASLVLMLTLAQLVVGLGFYPA